MFSGKSARGAANIALFFFAMTSRRRKNETLSSAGATMAGHECHRIAPYRTELCQDDTAGSTMVQQCIRASCNSGRRAVHIGVAVHICT